MHSATLEGTLGNAARASNKAMMKLGKGEAEFPLSKESLPTRKDKFVGTIKAFTKGGACLGAATGNVIMAPADLLLGHGRVRAQGEKGNILDKGLLGHGLEGVTTGVSFGTEMVGAGLGGLGAIVASPAKPTSNKPYKEWVRSGLQHGGKIGGKVGAHAVGTPIALGLNAARVPSVAVKGVLAGAFAIPSAVVGFIGGSIRAIFNV
jgi:hypothetical protein